MEIRRLAWAGLEVNADGETAVIDFVEDFSWIPGDDPPAGEIPPSPASRSAVAAEKSFGSEAEVALIDKPESALEESGLATRVVEPWETVEIGPFSFTALPAADGFGDPQVSWCIAAEGCRIPRSIQLRPIRRSSRQPPHRRH